MPLRLITGPANSAKARAVLDAYRETIDDDPILIVPTWADAQHYRRELASSGLVFGARVERFGGLIAEIARRTGLRPRPLSGPARSRLIKATLTRVELQTLGRSSATAGFASELEAFVAELGQRRVSPRRLAGALAKWADAYPSRGAHARDISSLYGTYVALLDGIGRPDGERHSVAALDALRLSRASWGAAPVFFYGFDDFTPLELDAIETLAKHCGAPVTVSLPYEAGRVALSGRAGTFQALAPLADRQDELPAQAEYYAPDARGPLHHLERQLFEAPAATARAHPGEAIMLLEGGGERAELELVAEEVSALLSRGIAPAEIALVLRSPGRSAPLVRSVFDARGIPFALADRRLLADTPLGAGLLALARCGEPGAAAGDLVRWLRTPGLVENASLVDGLEARLRQQGLRDAVQARALWEHERWPLDAIDRVAAARGRGPLAFMEALGNELDALFAAPRRRDAALLSELELPDARALVVARGALEDLAALTASDASLAPPPGELLEALGSLELPVGQEPGESRVLVADPLALRARRVRAVFACGLQEGVFPASASPPPLLSSEQRHELALASGLALAAPDALAAERYLFYATVSRAQERVVLSWRSGDDDGQPRMRSLFVDDVCDCFEAQFATHVRRRRLGAVREYATADESANGGHSDGPLAPLRDAAVLDELNSRPEFSASSLERWSDCPVRWFVERFLNWRELEPKAEPLLRGGLAHAVLEGTLAELRRRTGSARLTADHLELACELAREVLAREVAVRPALSPNPERNRVALRRLQSDLDRFLSYAASCATSFEPQHLELEFGMAPEDEQAWPALEIDQGLRLRGRIDRVDVSADGHQAIVYDYKGKNVLAAAKWRAERRLQLPLYMLAVRELLELEAVGAFYQPLGARDQRPRGALAAEADPELACLANDRLPTPELEGLIEGAVAQARTAAGEIRSGRLEPRPRTCTPQGGCAHPAICRCERS